MKYIKKMNLSFDDMRQSKTLESHKTKYPVLPQIGLKLISIGNYILNLSSLTTVAVLVTISMLRQLRAFISPSFMKYIRKSILETLKSQLFVSSQRMPPNLPSTVITQHRGP